MRRYYLHTRNGIFYAEILTGTGVKLSARSTRTRNRDDAIAVVNKWLINGLPAGWERKAKAMEMKADLPVILKAVKNADLDQDGAMSIVSALRERGLIDFRVTEAGQGREKFIPFLLNFWDMKVSPYLKDKKAHGRSITVTYCLAAVRMIRRHWLPRFGNEKTINEITRSDLREFALATKESGLSCSTVNNIMLVGATAIKWAHSEGIIPSDPSAGLTTFTGDRVSRDILTEEETDALFKIKWGDKRAYTAALLSLTTGLRSGEVRALRQNDIGESTLNIGHSWNYDEGLKCPKNGEKRAVPLLPEVRLLLFELLRETPHKETENPFIFYSLHAEKPCSSDIFLRFFRLACRSISIDTENRKLDFHSFRHYFSTRMAERMEGNKVAKITGHKSEAAAKIYQSHVTARVLSEMGNETASEFRSILQYQNRRYRQERNISKSQ